MKRYGPANPAVLVIAIIMAIAAAALVIWTLITISNILFPDTAEGMPATSCSKQYHSLADKSFDTHRWYTEARRDPATKKEHRRLGILAACANGSDALANAKDSYWRYYRKTIAPETGGGRRWAIPYYIVICESGAGSGSHNYYSMLNAWYEHWLPVSGNDTGTRFASSGWGATKLEQDVMAAVGQDHGAYWSCR